LFSGCEFGQNDEWSEQRGLDWWLLDYDEHRGVFRTVQDLNREYRKRPALWQQDTSGAGFSWLAADDADHNVFAFVRWSLDGTPLVCIVNFAGVPWEGYTLALPLSAEKAPVWDEVLNTDADRYGGSGVGNLGTVTAIGEEWAGWPARAVLRVPPLGALWLVPRQLPQYVEDVEGVGEELEPREHDREEEGSVAVVEILEPDELVAAEPPMPSETELERGATASGLDPESALLDDPE